MDAPQGAPAGLLHDGLDRAGIALHVLLEVFEHADASGLLFGLPAQGLEGLPAGGKALVPLLLTEFIAVDRVLQGRDRLVAFLEVLLRFFHFRGQVQVQGAAFAGGLFRPCGPVADLLDGGLGRGLPDAGIGQFGGEFGQLFGVGVLRLLLPADGRLEVLALFGDGLHFGLFLVDSGLEGSDGFVRLGDVPPALLLLRVVGLLVLFETGNGLVVELYGVLRDGDLRVAVGDLFFVAGRRHADLFDL